jgi:hypothetical protein
VLRGGDELAAGRGGLEDGLDGIDIRQMDLVDGFGNPVVSGGTINAVEGAGKTVKSNLGNDIDITPSSVHSSTTKNPGIKGTPNSSVDILDEAGNMETRRWYGPDGTQTRDVDFTNHGNPKTHPEVPHEHNIPRR